MQIDTTVLSAIASVSGSDPSSKRIHAAFEACLEQAQTGTIAGGIKLSDRSPQEKAAGPDMRAMSLANMSMNLNAADGAIHMEDQDRLADIALGAASGELGDYLAKKGISANPPLSFTIDTSGHLVVGDHPHRDDIKKIMDEHPEMTETIRTAMILKEHVVTMQKAAAFTQSWQNSYDSGGELAAKALFERFMALNEPQASLRFDGKGFDLYYGAQKSASYVESIKQQLKFWEML